MKTVVVLGGYGNFGRRIVAALAAEHDCRVYVGGRDEAQAATLAREVGGGAEPLRIDWRGKGLVSDLERVRADLVIHTAGPFQGQDYAVARACIAAGAHYVDLADGRSFVCGISALQADALANDVLVVSGASTLPALSSSVIDALAGDYSRIDSIEHGIAAGARPPGKATMEGVLAYAGRPFMHWCAGTWQRAWGWQGLSSHRYPRPAGTRWLTRCDVPDLDLFPVRYPTARTVEFRAGVAPTANMMCLWLAAGLVRVGILGSLAKHVGLLHRLARAIARFGTKCSAMHVTVRGVGLDGQPLRRVWHLIAEQDHGPFIPCFPAIALARRILRGEIAARGAMPCMGLLTTDDILAVGQGLHLRVQCSPDRVTPARS